MSAAAVARGSSRTHGAETPVEIRFQLKPGHTLPVEITRRKGTRHLKIRLGHQNQIRASAPWRCSDEKILDFIGQQRAWLEQQLAGYASSRALYDLAHRASAAGASGAALPVRIEAEPRQNQRPSYRFGQAGAELLLCLPEPVDPAALLRLVRGFARDALTGRVAWQVKRLGLEMPALSVRDQTAAGAPAQ